MLPITNYNALVVDTREVEAYYKTGEDLPIVIQEVAIGDNAVQFRGIPYHGEWNDNAMIILEYREDDSEEDLPACTWYNVVGAARNDYNKFGVDVVTFQIDPIDENVIIFKYNNALYIGQTVWSS